MAPFAKFFCQSFRRNIYFHDGVREKMCKTRANAHPVFKNSLFCENFRETDTIRKLSRK